MCLQSFGGFAFRVQGAILRKRVLFTIVATALVALGGAQGAYEVKAGDTIEGIARRLGVSQRALLEANPGVVPERLQIGQRLSLPGSSRASSAVNRVLETVPRVLTASERSRPGTQVYVVRNGDNEWALARRFGMSSEELRALNPGVDFHPLQIGTRIIVRAQSAAASEPPRVSVRVQNASRARTQTYVVRPGDNDWIIARRFGTTMRELHRLNPDVRFHPLQIGVRLRVPVVGGSSESGSGGRSVARITTSRARIAADDVNIRRTPSLEGAVITRVDRGTIARVLDREGSWYKLRFPRGTVAWVRGDLLEPVSTAQVASSNRRNPTSVASRPSASTRTRDRRVAMAAGATGNSIVDRAYQYLGVRYRWAGNTSRSGFDCSGFVSHVMRTHGVSLPRTSAEQSRVGVPVDKGSLRSGDLVFFRTSRGTRINHVGIYVGNGRFIHASSGQRRVTVSSLNEGYYARRFVAARRVVSGGRSAGRSEASRAKAQDVARKQAERSAVNESEGETRSESTAPTTRVAIGADEISR